MNNIKQVSRCFRLLFQACFIILPFLTLYGWMHPEGPVILLNHSIVLDFIPHGYPITHPISATTKIIGFFISLIPTSISLLILYFLIKLFRLYEQAIIFSLQNVKTIRNIGYALLCSEIIDPIYQALISILMTWSNRPGHLTIAISFSGVNIAMVLVAILTILISWIMAEGYRLQEEQQYTI
ncbi:DUF2975 domain-containing protein [soil metagenome]